MKRKSEPSEQASKKQKQEIDDPDDVSHIVETSIRKFHSGKKSFSDPFESGVLDYLEEYTDNQVITLDDDSRPNFENIGFGIVAGSQIYSARVDEIHKETFRACTNLLRSLVDENPTNGIDEDDIEGHEPTGKKKKHLLSDRKTANIEFEAQTSEIVKKCLSKSFLEGTASSLLMNSLETSSIDVFGMQYDYLEVDPFLNVNSTSILQQEEEEATIPIELLPNQFFSMSLLELERQGDPTPMVVPDSIDFSPIKPLEQSGNSTLVAQTPSEILPQRDEYNDDSDHEIRFQFDTSESSQPVSQISQADQNTTESGEIIPARTRTNPRWSGKLDVYVKPQKRRKLNLKKKSSLRPKKEKQVELPREIQVESDREDLDPILEPLPRNEYAPSEDSQPPPGEILRSDINEVHFHRDEYNDDDDDTIPEIRPDFTMNFESYGGKEMTPGTSPVFPMPFTPTSIFSSQGDSTPIFSQTSQRLSQNFSQSGRKRSEVNVHELCINMSNEIQEKKVLDMTDLPIPSDNISIGFFSLLHLANQEGLTLEQGEILGNVIVKKDPKNSSDPK